MVSWLDPLISFGKNNADWLIPTAGAIGGALSGGRDQTTTQSSAPVLPENVKRGYDQLLGYAEQKFNRPFDARPTRRVETGGNAFQQLFQNPELQQIQQQADDSYYASLKPAPQQQPQGTQTDDLTKQPTQSAGNIDELKARAIRELKMASQPSGADFARGVFNTGTTNNANRALELMPILEGMDGYKNEYTGTQFDLANYLQNLGDYYSEVNSGGVNSGLVSTQMSDKAKKASETYGQQQWNALKRPKKMDLVAPLAIAAITGGLGAFGGAGALASGLSSGKALSGAAQLAQMAAGK